MAIILVIAAIAIPNLSKQLMEAHETAAITEIGSIRQAELQYWTQFGRYATSLTQLGPPTSGVAGPAAAELIPESLANGRISGYIFTATGTPMGYAINA